MGVEQIQDSKPYSLSFPPQRISLTKKGKKWKRACVDWVINSSTSNVYFHSNPHRAKNIWENENLYEGILDEEALQYITKPFNVKDKLPARLKEYNIIKPLIDSMVGEEVNRPFSFSVKRTSENAKNERQQIMMQELIAYAQQAIESNLGPEQAQEYQTQLQSGQIQTPEALQEYMNRSFKDQAEVFCQGVINNEIQKLELRRVFLQGYADLLKHGEEIFYVGEEYGRPNARRVLPQTFCYEYSPTMDYIDDASWCSERMVLSYAELHDRYGEEIDDEDMKEILELVGGKDSGSKQLGEVYAPQFFNMDQGLDPNNPFITSSTSIEVWKVHWKSFRKILYVTTNNPETNQPETNIYDENYVKTGNEENIEEDWVMQVWQGHRIKKDIYFGIRPINVATDINEPTSIKLPYTGLVAHNKSLVEVLKPYQHAYLSIWYHIELLIARDNGRALIMDVTQIPKSMGIALPEWAHILKSMGVALINPYEDGWKIPGRDGSRPSAFTAFQPIDLSIGQSLMPYFELLGKIEQMTMQIIGFNPQRLGMVGHRDGAQATQQALNESYNTTAMIVFLHDKVKERVLRKLLNVAMAIRWRESDDYLTFVGDDGIRQFMNMPHSSLETMDLWVVDSQEEARKLQALQQLYQPALQNGATLADVAAIFSMNNTTEIRLRLEDIERRKEQMMQQQQEQQAQIQQQQFQQVETDRQINLEQKNADRQLKKYDIDTQAKIEMEKINLGVEQLMKDPEKEEPTELEIRKQELDEKKAEQDYTNKQHALEIQREIAEMTTTKDITIKQSEVDMHREKIEAERREAFDKQKNEERKLKMEIDELKNSKHAEEAKQKAEIEKIKLKHKQEIELTEKKTKELIKLEQEKIKVEYERQQAEMKKELALLKEQMKNERIKQKTDIDAEAKMQKADIASKKDLEKLKNKYKKPAVTKPTKTTKSNKSNKK